MDIYIMDFKDPEFDRSFKALDETLALNTEYNEVWQYMGTIKQEGQWIHQFRHRMHPRTKKREYFNVTARFGWEPRT